MARKHNVERDSWTREQWLEYANTYSMLPEYQDKTLPEQIRLDHEINRIQLISFHQEDYRPFIDKYFPQELLDDKQFMMDSFLRNMELLKYASERLLNDPQFALELLDIAEEKFDPDAAYVFDYSFLRMMGEGVKNSKEVWRTAIQTINPGLSIKDAIFSNMGGELRKDKEFLIEIASKKHEIDLYYRENPPDIYNCDYHSYEKINKKAKNCDWLPYGIICISEELMADKEFVLQIVSADPIAYASVGYELQKDKEVALAAYNSDNESIILLKGEIFEDKELALIAVAKDPENIFDRLSEELQADRDIMVAALSGERFEFRNHHIDPMLLADREIMKMAISNIGGNARYAPLAFRNDPEFVLETKCFEQMSDRLKKEVGNQDPEKCLASIINKNRLNSILPEKPITKAQQLSNDIEGEDFSYKPPTTRTARTKL